MKTTLFLMSILLATTLFAQLAKIPLKNNKEYIGLYKIVDGNKSLDLSTVIRRFDINILLTIKKDTYKVVDYDNETKTLTIVHDLNSKPSIRLKYKKIDDNIFTLHNSEYTIYFAEN